MREQRKISKVRRRAPGRPKMEDVVEIDRKVLHVALRTFLKDGYEATSMASIIRAAKVSKTTLYSRFPTKEGLFHAIMRQELQRFDSVSVLTPSEVSLGLEKGLMAYANRMLKETLQGDMLEVNRLIASESFRFPQIGIAIAEQEDVGIERISDFIRDCAVADKVPCKDPGAIAEAFVFMIRGWFLNTIMANITITDAQRQRWVSRTVHGLVSARADW